MIDCVKTHENSKAFNFQFAHVGESLEGVYTLIEDTQLDQEFMATGDIKIHVGGAVSFGMPRKILHSLFYVITLSILQQRARGS